MFAMRPETMYAALRVVADAGPNGVDLQSFSAVMWPATPTQRDPERRPRLHRGAAGMLGRLASTGYTFRVGRGPFQRFGLTVAGRTFLERWAEDHMRAPGQAVSGNGAVTSRNY